MQSQNFIHHQEPTLQEEEGEQEDSQWSTHNTTTT